MHQCLLRLCLVAQSHCHDTLLPNYCWSAQRLSMLCHVLFCCGCSAARHIASGCRQRFRLISPHSSSCRRPRGTFLSTLPSSSYSGGPVTASSAPQLLLAFTEPVAGLSTAAFNVTAASASLNPAGTDSFKVQAVQRANGTDNGSLYVLQLAVPLSYIGAVTVSLVVSLSPSQTLNFLRPSAGVRKNVQPAQLKCE